MKNLIAILIAAIHFPGIAQDVIYLKDGNKLSSEVTKIAGGKVDYKMAGTPENMGLDKLLMLFFKNGDYLVFSEMSESELNNTSWSKGAGGSGFTQDLIITKDEKIIAAKVKAVDQGLIKYLPKGSILDMSKNTNDVAAIIYASGKHQLLVSPADAAPALSAVKSKVNSQITAVEVKTETQATTQREQATVKKENEPVKEKEVTKEKKPEKKEEAVKESINEDKPVKEKDIAAETKTEKEAVKEEKKEIQPKEEPAKREEAPTEKTEVKKTNETITDKKPEEKKESSAPDIDFEMFKKKSLQKVEDLGTYISIIADKNTEWQESNKAIDLACALFVNEEATVEVSSKSAPEKTQYKIRAYMNRIKLLKYDKVEVSWTNISYVSDLRKGVDGNYYGVITLQQVFTGFIEGKIAYTDVTRKNIEVVLKGYEKLVEGKTVELWDVFLSDIGVVVTS